MIKFSILRYLKQFSLLIFIFAVIGALAILVYGRSRQHYIASTVIQYTNSAAKDGYMPDGSPLNVEEIYSSTVIDAALADLGYKSNIDSIRSNCFVEEVIPEKQQKLSEALLEKGEDPSYIADTFRVYIRDRALRLHSRDAHGLKFKIRHRAGRVLSQSLVDAKAYLRALYHLAAQQMFLYYLLCYRLPHLSTP